MAMNAIMSISFHTENHKNCLKAIDRAKKQHPNMTRSAIVRSLCLDGAEVQLYKEVLDYMQEQLNKALMPHEERVSWRTELKLARIRQS